MAKKRQQDFGKVKLKPGRHVKRSNLPSLKFKSRKIVMPKEKVVKKKSEYTIEDCTGKLKTASNEKDKNNLLKELSRLIRHSESFKTQLNDIFDTVTDLLRNPDDEVRDSAMKIILYVFENTEDKHLRHCAITLNQHIFAIMKHPLQKIATSSLVLLDCMVKNHPNLICHNFDILNYLIPYERAHFTRQPTSERGTSTYSETEEVNNLGHINTFFKGMLEKESGPAKDEDDDKDVYMDENKPMSLVLYSVGGLKPIDINEVISRQFNPQVNLFEQDKKIKKVISTLLSIIPGIFNRIIRCNSSVDDNTLRSESIKDLSIIAQLLFHMVEITERKSYTVATEQIATMIKEKLYSPYKKCFPFELLPTLPDTSLQHLATLNTYLCFLFMKFLFSNDSCDPDWELVEKYLKRFFDDDKRYTSVIKCNSIPLFIKMVQLFSYKTCAPDAIFFLLKQLVMFLKTRTNHPNKKKLINFLGDMSQPAAYRFWFESEPMKLWFHWLLSHLKENVHKLDEKLAKMIRRISKLRHPSFMNLIDFSVIQGLLKHRNEYVKDTGITLLSHMDVDFETYQDIFDLIATESFPRKYAVFLVEALNTRFHLTAQSEKAYVDHIQFLLNIAIGMYNITSGSLVDLNANSYTKAIKVVEHGCRFTVVPSLYWEVHYNLFKKCAPYLGGFNKVHVTTMLTRLIKEILPHLKVIPMHSALAMLKLERDYESEDSSFHELMLELNFSCYMTISVLTELPLDDEWSKWNVYEHENSFVLNEEFAIRLFNLLLSGDFSKGERPNALTVYYILRVIHVFADNNILNYKSTDTIELVMTVLEYLAKICSEKSLRKQPLYIELYNVFTDMLYQH